MDYRKEIDGLRALAIIPVILFHSGYSIFGGGFVGVDVFFVISGYLITTIILTEKTAGTFSISDFYERRARRILPALFVVTLICLIPSWLILSPEALKDFGQSLVATPLFASNFLFWSESGYFSSDAEEKPLLHTWSLAVEEQYYVVFPILMGLFWFLGQRGLSLFFIILALASLLYAEISSQRVGAINFYSTPARAWELLVGSLCAFLLFERKKPLIQSALLANISALIGLILVFYAILHFDSSTPFPSSYTLVPVLGTALILIFATRTTWVGQWLSLRPFVLIGLISYSLYLWHQPLFAFIKVNSIAHPSATAVLTMAILTFVLAYLSWRFVERPFRNKKFLTKKSIFIFSCGGSALLIVIGLVLHLGNGFDSRLSQQEALIYEFAQSNPKRKACHTDGLDYLKPSQACVYFGDQPPTWAILGDSHTTELAYTLAQRLEQQGQSMLHLSFSGCAPLMTLKKEDGCDEWTKEAIDYLIANKDISNVVIAYRYARRLFGPNDNRTLPNNPKKLSTADGTIIEDEELRQALVKDFKQLLHQLTHNGKKIFVFMPLPEMGFDVPKALSLQLKNKLTRDQVDLPYDYYLARNNYILQVFEDIEPSEQLIKIDPTVIFCPDKDYCLAAIEGKPLYYDDHHPSLFGAGLLVDLLLSKKIE